MDGDGSAAVHPRPLLRTDAPNLVLVVDDTPQIRLLIRLNLELEGHVVEEACDGDECLARLRATDLPRPDVVTIDAVMEPRDGWTTLADIRSDPALCDLPVVMVTASVQVHERARARAAGVDALVAKPFEPTTLVQVVERLAAQGRPSELTAEVEEGDDFSGSSLR